ncbi:MAG: hypothetical protein SOH60_05915 [Lachnospiraceae bacterium]|jgi:hypothetical protein
MIPADENGAHADAENGCIPESIFVRTLNEMDQAVRNFKFGNVADPADLTDF